MGDGNPRTYLIERGHQWKHNKKPQRNCCKPGIIGTKSFLQSILMIRSLDKRKKKTRCWLVIDVRNSEMGVNVICKRLISNLNNIEISIGFGWLRKIAHTRGIPYPIILNDTPLICKGRYTASRRAMAAPIQDEVMQSRSSVNFMNSIRSWTHQGNAQQLSLELRHVSG